jgi:hypothetical protein
MRRIVPLAATLLALAMPASALAADTFVDQTGDDTNNCTQATAGGMGVGPCKTIAVAITKTGAGNTVHIAPPASPATSYQENLSVSGGISLLGSSPGVIVDASGDCTKPALAIDATMAESVRNIAFTTAGCVTPQTGIDVKAEGSATTLAQVRLSGFDPGVSVHDFSMVGGGSLSLQSDVIAGSGTGLSASGGTVVAANATIAGPAPVSLTGTHLFLDSSILSGGGITADPGSVCAISYSRADSSTGSGCGDFDTTADPRFVGGATTPYALRSDSPLIDAGNPAAPSVSTDVYGGARLVDGDRDCDTRRDIGADEFDPGVAGCTPRAVTSVAQTNLRELLSIQSAGRIGNYTLCVDGPGKKQCKRFRARRSGGLDRSTVDWSRKFRYRGPGAYSAVWLTGSRRQRLGTPRAFTWGPCAPSNLSMSGVWKPHRLIVLDRCRSILGVPHTITHSSQDGDYHISFRHEAPNEAGVLEIIPRDQPRHIPRPLSGRRYRITGVFVCDTFHGPFGHTEIHPVFQTQLLGSGGRVLKTKTGGPQFPGTPNVSLAQHGRFHCPGFG